MIAFNKRLHVDALARAGEPQRSMDGIHELPNIEE